MKNKIRFALVGTSGIAHGHIKHIKSNPHAELVYVYSRNLNRAKEFAKKYNLIPTDVYADILNDNTIHAIDIVTEPNRHSELAINAIKHNKHVLIEKPLDTNLNNAKILVDLVNNSKSICEIISQKRFDSTILHMKSDIENNKIGKLKSAKINMTLKRTHEYYNNGNGWRNTEGNVLINQGIHWIDIIQWFFGEPLKVKSTLKQINNNINCYDTASVNFTFSNNFTLNLECTTASNNIQSENFMIIGDKGILDYKKYPKLPLLLTKALRLFRIFKSPMKKQIDGFIDSIANKRSPKITLNDGYNALKIVKSCENNNQTHLEKS